MLSMCGLICRFFHGWRQSEAISLMRQIAIWPQATLLIEKFDYLDADETKAIYCQPLGGFVIKKQLIWRENSKQVITTTPKERIDLLNWTKFESEDSQTEGNNKLLPPLTYNCINEITVVLEASYKSIGKTPNNFISVSEVAELFAWRGKETFAVIIKTTPSRLVSMIQAFFNDSLFLEMNLQIYKMSTVETTGHPIVETIVANQTYTDNVKQIVHNLGNQIENAKFHNKKTVFTGYNRAPGTFNLGSNLSRRFSDISTSSQASTSTNIFPHSIHHASAEANKQLKVNTESHSKHEICSLYKFPEVDFRQSKFLNGRGLRGNYYPLRIRSETDVYKATQLIRGNLANIVENYLSKLEVNMAPGPNAVVRKLSVMPQFYVPRELPRSIDDCAICDTRRNSKNNCSNYHNASDSSPGTKSESDRRTNRFTCKEMDSSISKVLDVEVNSPTSDVSLNEFSSDSLDEMDNKFRQNIDSSQTLLKTASKSLSIPMENCQIRGMSSKAGLLSLNNCMDSLSNPSDQDLECEIGDLNESFSSDSLGLASKSVKINAPPNSDLSSPEELSTQSVQLDFPSHWRDEYERMFAPVNNSLFMESVCNSIPYGLQPISEVDMVKGCSPDNDIDLPPALPLVQFTDPPESCSHDECHTCVTRDFNSPSTSVSYHTIDTHTSMDKLTDDLNQFNVVDKLKSNDLIKPFHHSSFDDNIPPTNDEAKCETASPPNKLSPVDSVAESGFVSLRDSEYNNSEPISDLLCGLPLSRSKENIDSQDFIKTQDNFYEEIYLGLSDSIPDSVMSSTRGSVSNTSMDQENVKTAFDMNFNKSLNTFVCNSGVEQILKSSYTENSIPVVDSISSFDAVISVNNNLHTLPGMNLINKTLLSSKETGHLKMKTNIKEHLGNGTRSKCYLNRDINLEEIPINKLKDNIETVDNSAIDKLMPSSSRINIQSAIEIGSHHTSSGSLAEVIDTVQEIHFSGKNLAKKEEILKVDVNKNQSPTSLKSMGSIKSWESSVTSCNSSSSDFQDHASLKSADSCDSFPHFDSIKANPKPKRTHRKILSVERDDSTDKNGKETTREEERAKRSKKKLKKVKTKGEANVSEKKFALKTLKEFLKVKSKDKEPKQEKIKSPSLLRRFENIGKNVRQKEHDISKRPTIVHKNYDLNDDMTANNCSKESINKSVLSENEKDDMNAINNTNILRKLSQNESPALYRKVLLRNMSSSQESIESKLCSRANEVNEPFKETKALSERKSFSVTIGFKPHIRSSDMSMSEGTDLHLPMKHSVKPDKQQSPIAKASSMEILVCGKIKEHGKCRRNCSSSREGSFRLHREISVETLFEDSESLPRPIRQMDESYQEFLQKVRKANSSRQGSNCSLCENGSMESLQSEYYKPRLSHKHSFIPSTRLSDLSEISSSNPNLTLGSAYSRGFPHSFSFTNGPYRRQYSSSTNTSPIKRPYSATPGRPCE